MEKVRRGVIVTLLLALGICIWEFCAPLVSSTSIAPLSRSWNHPAAENSSIPPHVGHAGDSEAPLPPAAADVPSAAPTARSVVDVVSVTPTMRPNALLSSPPRRSSPTPLPPLPKVCSVHRTPRATTPASPDAPQALSLQSTLAPISRRPSQYMLSAFYGSFGTGGSIPASLQWVARLPILP